MKNTSLLIFYSMIILFIGCSQENDSIKNDNTQTREEILINVEDVNTDPNISLNKNLEDN